MITMEQDRVKILGVSCFYHDAAAALLVDGRIVAAAQEERFTRIKHDDRFPELAIAYCLKAGGFTIDEIDYLVFYDKPLFKFDRILETYFKVWPWGLVSFISAMRVWLKEKLWIEKIIKKKLGYKKKIYFTEHHYSHAASAYYASDFDDAVVVTMDGVGEWDTTTIGFGKGNILRLTHTIHFPNSLGLLYSALTYDLGFKVNSAEYKVMGLAPYGSSEKYYGQFKKLVEVKEDGSFCLNMDYFAYEYGLVMTNAKFNELFEGLPRNPQSELEERHKDIAAALQKITEEVVLKIVGYARSLYPSKNLCLAGGVALNCVANGKILEKKWFENIYVQPAAGDAGGAIGAACYLYFDVLKNDKIRGVMPNAYLGPEYSIQDIKEFLDRDVKPKWGEVRYDFLPDPALLSAVAKLIADNSVVGWFQGRMEFGPRALGNRSILADARDKNNWQRVNLKIKFRESFRPFAPSVLAERADDFFDLKGSESPYMLLVAQAKNDTIPAVTHVDNSARVQTVKESDNPRFYRLIKEFEKLAGCPVVINTSFNVRGEPIVCSPEDAFNCFVNTDIDYLVMGNFLISKKDSPQLNDQRSKEAYLNRFELD